MVGRWCGDPDRRVRRRRERGCRRHGSDRRLWRERTRHDDRTVVRAHAYKEHEKHGFIGSQKEGLAAFRQMDPQAPLIVAEAVWQYSHHLLPGLLTHRGPILTVANWSGQWPGLVGMLNLNGSLTKAGIPYSTLWSEAFTDEAFKTGLRSWLETGTVAHDTSHVHPAAGLALPNAPALALTRHGEAAGTAAALLGAVQFGIGAISAPLTGVIGDGSVAMAVVVAGAMVAALVVLFTVVRPGRLTGFDTGPA